MTGKTSAQRITLTKKSSPKSPKRTAKRVEFELAHGGLVSKTHMDSDSGEYQEPKTGIHSSLGDAKVHLARSLGHAFGDD